MSQIMKINKLLRGKEITAKELSEKYIAAIKRDNKELRAFVKVTEEEAMEAADREDKAIMRGEETDPLCGVPMVLKDNISTKGIETTCCSEILKGYKPIYDATVWQRLSARGAVLLGKANMDEFAMGSTCETSCFGGAKNPFDTRYSSGGSSGGSAAAVGGNLAVYSLGSDTGGSVRQPASFCSLVGLKPTYGAVSRYGLIAYASSLDQIGPITSTVSDAALVFDAIAGKDMKDSTLSATFKADTFRTLKNDIKGKTVGVAKEFLQGLDSDVMKAFEEAVRTFEHLGAKIIYTDMPEINYSLPAYYILACAEASSNLGRYDGIRFGNSADIYDDVNEMVSKVRSEGFGEEVKRRILLGTYVLSKGYGEAYYKKAQSLRNAVKGAFDRAFEKCDVLLTPVSPVTAYGLLEASSDPVKTYQSDVCTVPVNIASLPAVSVPASFDSHGLPIGIQLIGKRFEEHRVLNFAYKFEQAVSVHRTADWGVKL